jgi:hypothetical protein
VLVIARGVAAVLIAVLSAGPVSRCGGWQATPEARMACCLAGATCPMHTSDDDGPGATRGVTQAEADSCCAAGAPDDASPTAQSLAAVIAIASTAPPLLLPPPLKPRAASVNDPAPARDHGVSRHLLLSVFLI